MNIILMGYMGSGKSLIGQELSKALNLDFVDFDSFIEEREGVSINIIFETKGEIHFRKLESLYLKELLDTVSNSIVSLGGGTPCYGNNIQLIKSSNNAKSIYLNLSVSELSNRLLKDKAKRPLLKFIDSKMDMDEFVGKHLFERINFYNQADIIINANKKPKDVVEEIVLQLF